MTLRQAKEDRLYVLIQSAQALNNTLRAIRKYGYKKLNLTVEEYQDRQFRLMVTIDRIERTIIKMLQAESGKEVHLPEETLPEVLGISRNLSKPTESTESGT